MGNWKRGEPVWGASPRIVEERWRREVGSGRSDAGSKGLSFHV